HLVLLGGIAFDRAGHAARPAAAAAELAARDGDHLDAVLAQHGVGGDVAFVPDDDAGSHGQVVGAVVPLLSLGRPDVLVGAQHRDLVHVQGPRDGVPQI